jgi:hypothetical protein
MSTVGRYAEALDADVGYAVRSRAGAPAASRSRKGVPDVDE